MAFRSALVPLILFPILFFNSPVILSVSVNVDLIKANANQFPTLALSPRMNGSDHPLIEGSGPLSFSLPEKPTGFIH